jgi:glutaredoxin-like YruB-family protein
MKEIEGIQSLKQELQSNEKVWLLLMKKGSDQSDCAINNYKQAAVVASDKVLCFSDVTKARDIHPEFGITSVPSLLFFENGQLKNVVKGCQQPEQFKVILDQAGVATKTDETQKPQKNVLVYTTPTCSWCTTLKRHLDHYGVRYREINVAADMKAAEAMVKKSGQQGVPQTEINGQMIVGFDKSRINTLLGIN